VTRSTLVLRYTAFAVLATLANLGVQRIVLMAGEGAVIFALAMVAGTAAGLVLKYILDKRYIFNDATTGLRASGQQFLLYTVMGLVTTALFWATETAFWLIWRTDAMRELGAVLGLSVGYVVKYKLDSKYVFTRTEATA
jgi:putative flippase GtrA